MNKSCQTIFSENFFVEYTWKDTIFTETIFHADLYLMMKVLPLAEHWLKWMMKF